MWIAILFVLALATLPRMLSAQQQPPRNTQSPLRAAVAACVAIVRQETDDRVRFKLSEFDAYSRPDGTVVWFGTPKEQFSFEKCMSEAGYPLNRTRSP